MKTKKFKLGPIQRAWVRALRSGKYKQCTNFLTRRDGDKIVGHCCLGVLCQLAIKKGLDLKPVNATVNETVNKTEVLAYNKEYSELPTRAQRWAGLRNADGDFSYEESLVGLNDEGKSFNEIAKIIEKNAAEIFTRSV